MHKSSMENKGAALSPVLFHHNFGSRNRVLNVHLLLISGNETKKDRADRHDPQNLTADHITGINYTGGHQNVNQLTVGHMTGVPNLGGRQNGDQVAAEYFAGGYPNVGNSAIVHAPV